MGKKFSTAALQAAGKPPKPKPGTLGVDNFGFYKNDDDPIKPRKGPLRGPKTMGNAV